MFNCDKKEEIKSEVNSWCKWCGEKDDGKVWVKYKKGVSCGYRRGS